MTNVRDVNDAKTSYHVVVDRADHDDDQELPQRTLPLNKGEGMIKPEWSVEPKVRKGWDGVTSDWRVNGR